MEYIAEFLTPLDLRALPEPGEWEVLNLLGYQSANGVRYYVPPTFITDLASFPQPMRAIVQRSFKRFEKKTRRPSALHDYRYCVKQGTREQADALFLEALEAEGVNLFTRRAMWLAVRAWGWRYWNARTGITSEDFVDG